MKNKRNVNPLLHALLPVIITVAYILIGFLFDSGWAIGWILFLLIPIVETLINAINTKNPSHFAYPVLVTAIFLFTGMMWGLWHPMWALFVTIPAYYAICDAVKKSRPQQEVEYQPPEAYQQPQESSQQPQANQGTYYQPQVNTPYQQPKTNTTAIIISIVVSIAVVAIVAIVFIFSWLSGESVKIHGIFDNNYQSAQSYVKGPFDVAIEGIEDIDIEWVNGNVEVQYYDGDTIYIEESSSSDKYPMIYRVDGRTLYICEFTDNASSAFANKAKKDLTVKIPDGFKTNDFSVDIVSANLTAAQLNTYDFDIDSVSGNSHISFVSQPHSIEADTVSGDIQVVLPSDISGYSISKDSVSGTVNTNDFDNAMHYGDGYTEIEINSVSGNLTVEKAE